MSEFESEPTPPGRATASVAFARALTGVDTRCTDLTALLDTRDLEHVVHIARSATNLWLTGRAAYRRLAERARTKCPPVEAARRRLESAYALLLNVITRAGTLIQAREIGSDLDDIRLELMKAAAQPIDVAAASRGDDTQDMAIDD